MAQNLGKIPYEIITGKKHKVHYFRVFGCKCFILNKKTKKLKFEPKVDEGFLLGYGTNEHDYLIFNKTAGCIVITVDVTFDESNGSQEEQANKNFIDQEEPPSVSIMRMGLGEVRPREENTQAPVEVNVNDQPLSSTRVEPPSSQVPQDQSQAHGDDHDYGMDQGGAQGEEAQEQAPQAENDDDGGPIQPQRQVSHPRVHQTIQWIIPLTTSLGVFEEG